jgi:hypothetical protein
MNGAAALAIPLFLIGIAITFRAYSDAKRNGPRSAVLRALVAFFAGVLGLLRYFLPGRDTSGGRRTALNT